MTSPTARRIARGIRRRIPNHVAAFRDSPQAVAAKKRIAEWDDVANAWRDVPVRNKRINQHLAALVTTAGVTGGRVLEIGGRMHPRGHVFGGRFSYQNLDLQHSDEHTVIGDITACPEIPDGSYDVVLSVDVFEHIDRPWLAAAEIVRILKPGGLAYTSTLFSWRYHPCPIDFWRYTPDALRFLFAGLDVIEDGFDTSERRRDMRKQARLDPIAVDAMGGWRENVRVFHAGRKPALGSA